ncbi:MAG TPA: hypothetical protein VJT49_06895 [Amycolatopsis sp.]|uniref:hypothetical protein n=1 Tax=Amycolatopsis sp. TaxID=37632 RepID=UPI002B467CD1|nr:hypothetical protein [Amycolatopsis sp.]HKS44834.1 hypothetical protein [Amycolatopsis sp.]
MTSGAAGATSDQVTRYLCGAARMDERFADRVLHGLLAGDLRAVAPSVGFDLRPVLLHCLAARRQRFLRDVVLTGAGLVALFVAPLWTVLSLGLIAVFGGTITRADRGTRPRAAAIGAAVVMVLIPVLFAVFITSAASAADEEAAGSPGWLTGLPWLGLPIILLMYGVVAWDLLSNRRVLVRDLARTRFRPEAAPSPREEWLTHVLATIDQTQHGNATVYSGFNPFLGHGTPQKGWAFALPMWRRGRENPDDTVDVDVPELIEHVRNRLRAIGPAGTEGELSDRLDDLRLSDRVFVNGEALGLQPRFLPCRDLPPRQNLAPEEIREIATQPSGIARHYLCAEVPSWGGEVVASTFLHFSTDGRLLYLQCDRAVLGPVWRQYHDVDRLTETAAAGQIGRLLIRAAGKLVGTALRAPAGVFRTDLWAWSYGRRLSRNRLLAQDDLGYDYGARFSVRQVAVDARPHNYFQETDAGKHLKIVERHVLSAVLDFLGEHDVDTAEFATRQMMILNQGIIQTGGVSNVGNQAVGSGATATQQGVVPPRPGSQETANA